jgi:TonB family protein
LSDHNPTTKIYIRIKRTAAVTAFALFFCGVIGFVPRSFAQKTTKFDRKIIVSVKPEYSDVLRHAQIGGLVRLRATVTSDGKVTHVDVIGGNPILADSAAAAVMRWKFVPTASQTIEDLTISFSPY